MLRPAVSVGADLLIALETKPLRQAYHLIVAGLDIAPDRVPELDLLVRAITNHGARRCVGE
jgi:hypothetical protein